ncbi:E7 protein [Equus asinus papillomavirus 2]|uniref:Protein E7 n=1 Tax=Equus asinus papillomavirus 2 TaxID=2547428 RepID=A0A482EZ23_9PAPI|nr:E7 protein [Equus asinus papillomavirus 2]
MIGSGSPSLKEIVLSEVASLSDSSEEEEVEVDLDIGRPQDPYAICTVCCSCGDKVSLCVLATDAGIHGLEQLLFDALQLFCTQCAPPIGRHGR